MNTKICNKCKIEKSIENFYYKKNRKCYESYCKDCQKQMQKEYIIKNREKINALARKQYQKNKQKHKLIVKKYRQKNKEKIKQYYKNWYFLNKDKVNKQKRNRRQNDNIFKIKGQIRHLIKMSFERKGFAKNGHTQNIIGCDFDYFYNHLLETFKNNYGYEYNGIEKVHIDHIIPLATAKTEEDIIKLCHYTNLQLLKAQDNYDKNSKLNWKLDNKK